VIPVCGIVAVHRLNPIGRTEVDEADARRMLHRIAHRGPDGEGLQVLGGDVIAHARLSIVDLAGGAQPLESQAGSWIVANGEIYNHEDVRAGLDFPFRTDSDSEAALAVVEVLGVEGVSVLRGMYAFVVVRADGEFVAARDPLGIKPLYWAESDGVVSFASELRAFDTDQLPAVREFPPGHTWSSRSGLSALERATTTEPAPATHQQARERIRAALVAAVERRMMADLPVGVFLSGGLDSSIVAAIMARVADPAHGPVRSFAAGTAGSSDLLAARRVAEHLGLDHTEIVYSADDAVEAVPDVVRSIESYEPSLVRSAVPNYLLSEVAARSVKVVLTGEGADELFAGYAHYLDMDADDLQAALDDSVDGLHNLNLQRCDRVTMAHGLEARVPFLDVDVLALARQVPIDWRLPRQLGQEKAILREAFAGWLPDDLLWRVKEQFGDGSGTAEVMRARIEDLESGTDWASTRVDDLPAPRSREELAYQRVFAAALPGVRDDVIGRFATA